VAGSRSAAWNHKGPCGREAGVGIAGRNSGNMRRDVSAYKRSCVSRLSRLVVVDLITERYAPVAVIDLEDPMLQLEKEMRN